VRRKVGWPRREKEKEGRRRPPWLLGLGWDPGIEKAGRARSVPWPVFKLKLFFFFFFKNLFHFSIFLSFLFCFI
jgi:hypothetical protein